MGSTLLFYSSYNETRYVFYCPNEPKWVLFKLLTSRYRAMIYIDKFTTNPEDLSVNNECIVIIPQNLSDLGIDKAYDIDYIVNYNTRFKYIITQYFILTANFDSFLQKEEIYKNLNEHEIASIYKRCNGTFNIEVYSFDNGELALSNAILDELILGNEFITTILGINTFKEYAITYSNNNREFYDNIFDVIQQYYYNIILPINAYLKELKNQCNNIEKIVKEKDINQRNELIKKYINIRMSEEFIKQWGGDES